MPQVGDKYIIEIGEIYSSSVRKTREDERIIPPGVLFRMKNFKSLVFDGEGLSKLERLEEKDEKDQGFDVDAGDAISRKMLLEDIDSWVAMDSFERKYQERFREVVASFPSAEPEMYARWEKIRDRIKVGDEVRNGNGIIGIVTKVVGETPTLHIVDRSGSPWTFSGNTTIKTGRSFPELVKILADIDTEELPFPEVMK